MKDYDQIVLTILENDDLEELKGLYEEEQFELKKPMTVLKYATLMCNHEILQYLVNVENIKPIDDFSTWLSHLKDDVKHNRINYSDEEFKENQLKNIQFIEQYI